MNEEQEAARVVRQPDSDVALPHRRSERNPALDPYTTKCRCGKVLQYARQWVAARCFRCKRPLAI